MRYIKDDIIFSESDLRTSLPHHSLPETLLPEHVVEFGFAPYVEPEPPAPTAEQVAVGSNASGWSYYEETGQKFTNNVGTAFGATWAANGDVIGIALDMDSGKVWFSKNGVWQGSGDPSAGTNPAFSGLSGTFYAYASLYRASGGLAHQVTANFGATALTYSAPSGFRAGLYQ